MTDKYFMTIWNFLAQDELYSPIAFIAFGTLTLLVIRLFKALSSFESDAHTNGFPLASVFRRLENRSSVSWVLIVGGLLWLGQILVEFSWAR